MASLTNVIGALRMEEQQLVKQLAGIRQAITLLEVGGRSAVGRTMARRRRRRRRTMSAAQRAAVSKRMKAYWAKRKQKGA